MRVAPLSDPGCTSPAAAGDERRPLRRELRARRRAIQGTDRRHRSRQLARRIDALRLLRPGRRIGLYVATLEEIDTAPLLQLAKARGCRIALPRVTSLRHDRMRFFDHTGAVRSGAFGIGEPQGHAPRAARELDVVFVPLVGFDARGARIGMGRGFYDRHFAFRSTLRQCRRPLLVGLAYAVQQVPRVPTTGRDVPLDAIVTECSTLLF